MPAQPIVPAPGQNGSTTQVVDRLIHQENSIVSIEFEVKIIINGSLPASQNQTSLEHSGESTTRPVKADFLHGSFYDKTAYAISAS